jgi:DNA-binding NarL/FixJ family response regulator
MDHEPVTRILIADDHRLFAEACKTLLEPEFQVIGIVTDGRTLLKAAAELEPDVVILDIAMPLLNGLDAAEQIHRKLPGVALVYLTMNAEPDTAAEAFRRGASGYVLKQSASEELLLALREAVQGRSYLSSMLAKETMALLINNHHRKSHGGEDCLSTRQIEVLQLLVEGMSMKEIGDVLDLRPATVAFHKYRMMENLGVKSNAELLEYGIKRRMTLYLQV